MIYRALFAVTLGVAFAIGSQAQVVRSPGVDASLVEATALAAQNTATNAAATATNARSMATNAITKADAASTTAQAASDAANAAATAAAGAVRTVNGIAPVSGAVTLAIPAVPDLTPYAKATDLTSVSARVTAMEVGPVSEFATVKANALLGATAAPYARVKWAGQALQTNAAGTRTISVPAGLMTTGLALCGVSVRSSGQFALPVVTATGTPATGYTVALAFSKAKSQVTVPAVVVGAGAVNLALFETSPGAVVFDVSFCEPDVIGP